MSLSSLSQRRCSISLHIFYIIMPYYSGSPSRRILPKMLRNLIRSKHRKTVEGSNGEQMEAVRRSGKRVVAESNLQQLLVGVQGSLLPPSRIAFCLLISLPATLSFNLSFPELLFVFHSLSISLSLSKGFNRCFYTIIRSLTYRSNALWLSGRRWASSPKSVMRPWRK